MRSKPNIVLMFLDDSGWADFRPFGDTPYPTPNVERLASEGCRYNQFYVPQAICSASRASLLTGCYPGRHKVYGAIPPRARGLNPSFTTISEMLKPAGYATGVFGKWHCGDHEDTRPPARGFDESSGLMYSNDMWKHHPESRNFDDKELQFWKNGKIEIHDVSPEQQRSLTTWYTEHAVDFIQRHKEEAFFCYVPHNMPHVPLYCSDKFEGKSGHGLYADVMMEIDWSMGEILRTLEETGLTDDTLVIFTSDNGPWISYGNHAGSTPYREAKGTGFDGGTRSACVMRCPEEIPAGSASDQAFCSVDLFPTFAKLAAVDLTDEIDGVDVWDLITCKPDATNSHDYYPISTARTFDGVVSGDGKWKLHLPHSYRTLTEAGTDGQPGRYAQAQIELSLFDMMNDPYETTNVIGAHPEIAAQLQAYAEKHRDRWWTDLPLTSSSSFTSSPTGFKDVDRAFFDRELGSFLPDRIYDAHAHIWQQDWADFTLGNATNVDITLYDQAIAEIHDGKPTETLFLSFATPDKRERIGDANAWLGEQLADRPDSRGHYFVTPQDDPEQVREEVNRLGLHGLKCYHTFAEESPTWEASIPSYLPEPLVAMAHEEGWTITLHMVKARAVADPDNQHWIRHYCETYPDMQLILAHSARGFQPAHNLEGLPTLTGLDNLWFDTAVNCEPFAHQVIIRLFGHERLMYGSDLPVSHMRGRSLGVGDDFSWLYEGSDALAEKHKQTEPVLVGLEHLRSIRWACWSERLSDTQVEDIFWNNAARLFQVG